MSATLEERLRLLESVTGETHAFAVAGLALVEQAVAAALAVHEDPDALLEAIHKRARERIAPLAATYEDRALANRMYSILEAVLLHAAQVRRKTN